MLQRREFLMSAAGLAVSAGWGMASGSFVLAAPGEFSLPQPGAELKLSSQLGVIPGKSLEEKLEKMKKWGFDAVELPGDVVGKVEMYAKAAANAGLKISAVCWGSAGGALVSEDPARREEGISMIKEVLAAAGELQSTGVIFVPAFNGQTKLTNQEIRKVLLDILPGIGEYAVSVKSRVLLEPLNRGEAFFLRQVADAAAICRDVNSPGICLMGDFYHMYIEEPSDFAAFVAGGPWLHHVHLASRKRVLPGQDERSFIDGFRGLKWVGYKDYCSFECGVQGDREVEIPKALAFLRDQWEKATLPGQA
ncbi:sugar phosphate isomerase/epimerase family protein [Thermogutta sp.]|uniref:sugar phosphate isomerase/epimerase family protein n=1 Tax=Thermogutta sp. TaxID=1962930 RepID=UPI00322017AE